MKSKLWIVGVTVAALLLMLGVYQATRPTSVLLTPAQAKEQLEDAAARFSAAIENGRDVRPIYAEVRPIVDQHPQMRDGRVLLGQWHVQVGEPAAAYDQFAAALELEPDDAPLQNLAGSAAMLAGEESLALTHHQLAVGAEPDNPRWLLPLADVLTKTGHADRARLVMLEALRLDSTMHQANAGLADIYAQRGGPGDNQRAIDQLEIARAIVLSDPDSQETMVTYVRKLARLYARQDNAMESARVLDTLLPDAARRRPVVMAEMAEYLAQNGQPLAAALEYQLALEADPDNADFTAEAARWLIAGNQPAAAAEMLERLRLIDANDPRVATLTAKLGAAPEADGP